MVFGPPPLHLRIMVGVDPRRLQKITIGIVGLLKRSPRYQTPCIVVHAVVVTHNYSTLAQGPPTATGLSCGCFS